MQLQYAEFVDKVAEMTKQSPRTVRDVLQNAGIAISLELQKGNEIRVTPIGKFYTSRRQPSTGRNPRNGEPIEIAAKTLAKFQPAKALRDDLN